jgi:hypothetical protein
MIQIPEIKIKAVLDAILELISSDYTNTLNVEDTFLFGLFGTLKSGEYNFFDEAVKIFIKTKDDPRIIDTRLQFDRSRANIPTIHITFPPEQPSVADGIGFDEGAVQNQLNFEEVGVRQFYSRTYNFKMELIVTGSNTFEVIIIATVLKAVLINNYMTLEVNGFMNPKIYGGDVMINDNLIPNAFMRTVFIDSYFQFDVPLFGSVNLVNSIDFSGKAYLK